jgi:hypothetical protein
MANLEPMLMRKFTLSIATVIALCGSLSFGGDYLDEMKRKASEGDRNAQATLAYLYRSGKGVPKNIEEARKWERSSDRRRSEPERIRASAYQRIGPQETSRSRMVPRRPESNSTFRQNPTGYGYYPSNSSVRLPPTRPSERSRNSTLTRPPQRPPANMRRERTTDYRYERLASNVEDYRRLEGKSPNKLIKSGKIILSPISFILKKSKKAVTKVARKLAWGAVIP